MAMASHRAGVGAVQGAEHRHEEQMTELMRRSGKLGWEMPGKMGISEMGVMHLRRKDSSKDSWKTLEN